MSDNILLRVEIAAAAAAVENQTILEYWFVILLLCILNKFNIYLHIFNIVEFCLQIMRIVCENTAKKLPYILKYPGNNMRMSCLTSPVKYLLKVDLQ